MVEMENDWTKLGKQMPYRLPEAFFEQNARAILARVAACSDAQRPTHPDTYPAARKMPLRLPLISGIAAAVALCCLVALWQVERPQPSIALYAYAEDMADDELASWIDFYEADLFLSAVVSEE